jgi:hypothetical protein
MNSKRNLQFKREKLQIDRELARVARERLEFDVAEAASEKRFWKMGAGTRITILVSAAVIVTLIVQGSSVLTSWIAKEKEIRVSANQRQVEQEKLETQKKREWDLALAQFVLTNQKAIFNGTPEERQVLAKIIPTIFPEDVSVTLFERLEKTTPPPAKAIWTQAKTTVENQSSPELKPPPRTEATNGGNKSIASAAPVSSSSPAWLSGTESSRLSSLDLDSNITIGGNIRSPFVTPVGLMISPTPALSDLVYRPPSSFTADNLSSDVSKLLVSTPTSISTDGPTIEGTIVDAGTGKPIAGATIEFKSQPNWISSAISLNSITAKSDESGNFSIVIPFGRYSGLEPMKLEIAGDGYKSTAKEVKNSYSSLIPVSLGNIALEKGTPNN